MQDEQASTGQGKTTPWWVWLVWATAIVCVVLVVALIMMWRRKRPPNAIDAGEGEGRDEQREEGEEEMVTKLEEKHNLQPDGTLSDRLEQLEEMINVFDSSRSQMPFVQRIKEIEEKGEKAKGEIGTYDAELLKLHGSISKLLTEETERTQQGAHVPTPKVVLKDDTPQKGKKKTKTKTKKAGKRKAAWGRQRGFIEERKRKKVPDFGSPGA